MPNSFLINLEKKLRDDYLLILNQEAQLWSMKSRYNWAIHGDRSTAFFHTSTLVRRKRNRIHCIKTHLEEWIHDEEVVVEIIREGFLKLFCTEKTSAPKVDWSIPRWPTFLFEESIRKLNLPVTYLEIKVALWSIKPFKAPDPDGLHAEFFPKFLAVC